VLAYAPRVVGVLVAVVLAAIFGGTTQYLGSLSAHPWATEVSLLSAPWLLLPFLAGWTQRAPGRAAALGLVCTLSALFGYGLMTLSPIENAELSSRSVAGFIRSQSPVIVSSFVTGPLFGWFGYRWRERRAWLGALLIVAAFSLEPLARIPAGHEIRFRAVWVAEIGVGLALLAYFATEALRSRR
jgi:hypothetical protein